jgi:hypothetical protein
MEAEAGMSADADDGACPPTTTVPVKIPAAAGRFFASGRRRLLCTTTRTAAIFFPFVPFGRWRWVGGEGDEHGEAGLVL